MREAFSCRRLLTLTGVGGIGKTRLAVRFACEQRPRLTGGVCFCDLESARTYEDIQMSVALSLGLESAVTEERIVHTLEGRGRTLLLLDNIEGAVAHAATAISRWLEVLSRARFLVTSRERLRLREEAVIELSPLGLPPQSDEATRLFVERARAAGALEFREAELRAIGDIVRKLDGNPLAIELAAARTALLEPTELLYRLSHRFDVLTHGARDGARRQRSLRAAIDWSWDLLSFAERLAFKQLSVFHADFDLRDAEGVLDLRGIEGAPSPLDVLQSLHDKSILVATRKGSSTRFALYESLREYAVERLMSGV